MKQTFWFLLCIFLIACSSDNSKSKTSSVVPSSNPPLAISGPWEGSFSNGMKGAKISFIVSGNEKELKELTFQGYWRCDGRLELTTVAPEESYPVHNNAVDGSIVEPKGGAAPFRFELHAKFIADSAEGTLRISNVQAGCDTYKLKWTAHKK